MAKYVGKIFKANNKDLGLRGLETHYIKVKWYNPKKKKFLCRVVTSLETKYDNLESLRNSKLKNKTVIKDAEKYYVLDISKYKKIRKGIITPIPIKDTKGFNVWSGYYNSRYITLDELKNLEKKPNMYIKNKKHGV